MSWKKEIKDTVSVKYRKEAEKSMKKAVKRIFSGVLSALTILTSVVQPITAMQEKQIQNLMKWNILRWNR